MPEKKRAKDYASVRLQPKLKHEIKWLAQGERRSLSSMILILLEEAIKSRQDKEQDDNKEEVRQESR